MSLDTMPAEVRQRIIEHLLPNIVDEAMQICPCLAKAPRRAQKSCSCFENGLSWDDPYRRSPSNIALLHRPTLLVNHRKMINWALLKFNVLQFESYEDSTVGFEEWEWFYQYELEEGLTKQIGYMMRARKLWARSDPNWVDAACFKYFKEDDGDLQYHKVELSLDLAKRCKGAA